ncbi:thiamine biosynthesis lipoprotein [Cognatiyoonia sediminum]|uniref:FAD:protein FMN transferase n=1 Tax=Cognatiyoonia sediminum TaxID=1508389 RepID=A0A1M5SE85_9RHOB|nr:thiamine biosynthesis lipoprotein [Cognatiyoonia sediminum]
MEVGETSFYSLLVFFSEMSIKHLKNARRFDYQTPDFRKKGHVVSTPITFTRRTFLVMPLALAACNPRAQVMEFLGLSMGTSYKVVAIDHNGSLERQPIEAAISSALADVNASMSNWDSGSEISRFNAQSGTSEVNFSPDLAEVMSAAADVNAVSAGRFDTTIGPLIELWGFGANGEKSVPTDALLQQAMARSGHENTLHIDNGSAQKKRSDAQVYLAGIGKGFGADKVGRALESFGITDYLVEIGGDLYAAGRNPDGLPWQIGIETPNPTNRGILNVVGVSNMGMASSGDYRNYFEVDGQRFSHLIDPTTGRPVDHTTASATVLAENAMLADAWSTAMLILGREQGIAIADRQGIAVQFVERDPAAANLQFKTETSAAFDQLTA